MQFASRFVQVAVFAVTSIASVAVAGQTPLAQLQPGQSAQVPAWEQQQVKADHEAAEARLHVSRAPAELPSIRDLVGMATRRFIGCQVRDGRVDATLRTAHDILRVSAVQEPQWGRFSDRVKVLMDQLKPACWAPPLDPAMPLQERLYRMSADSRTDVAVFQGLSQEVASIYAVLDVAQRAMMDDFGRYPDHLFHPADAPAVVQEAPAEALKDDGEGAVPAAGLRVQPAPPVESPPWLGSSR